MERATREVQEDLTGASVGKPLDAWEARGLRVTEGSPLAAALATSLAASELASCAGIDQVLESAIAFARHSIGLERVAFYLREPHPRRLVLRGNWGTGSHGEAADEHGLTHELCFRDGLALLNLRKNGACALYRPRAQWFAVEGGRARVLGHGWVMVTPLISGNDLIGVIYNDAALSHGAPDPSKQAALAVLANFVSIECVARRAPTRWVPLHDLLEPTSFVQQVRNAVDQNLATRGHELAAEFGISPGHLARAFKREMGISLVEYRNRKRIARFREVMRERGPAESLKAAAIEAGFGSYAQFSRIHKRFTGEEAWRKDEQSGHVLATSASSQQRPGPWPPVP
jgi:AraC-like DNA-binding protein